MKTCPNCGYCPHCGRSAQPSYPLYPVAPTWPTWPTYPKWTNETITVGGNAQPGNTTNIGLAPFTYTTQFNAQ